MSLLFAYAKEECLSLVWRKGPADLRPSYSYFGAVCLALKLKLCMYILMLAVILIRGRDEVHGSQSKC